ncbi:MAG: nucleotidyltransferase domain-containing protein [bacterium]
MALKITQEQKNRIAKIAKRYNLEMVLLFGSQINGKARPDSDLDIAVLDNKPETYQRFGNLFNLFSRIFSGFNIDLRLIKNSEPVLLFSVFNDGQLLYGDTQKYFNYKAFAYKNYVDSKPLFELKQRLLEKRQKKLNKLIND